MHSYCIEFHKDDVAVSWLSSGRDYSNLKMMINDLQSACLQSTVLWHEQTSNKDILNLNKKLWTQTNGSVINDKTETNVT